MESTSIDELTDRLPLRQSPTLLIRENDIFLFIHAATMGYGWLRFSETISDNLE